jgi:hypothetical protein
LSTTHLCTLLGGFSWELHYADYSWGISIKSPRAYFINSGVIPRRQLLKSAPCGNLKSTPVAPSPPLAAYYVCKLRWNLAVSGPRVLATMVPAARGLHTLYLGSEIHGPCTQVDYSRNLQVHYGGNRTLGPKSMAQEHKCHTLKFPISGCE